MADKKELIDNLMLDVVGKEPDIQQDAIVSTISEILREYNLSTDLSFVQNIAEMKFGNKGESIDITAMPKELQDAAFLPVNTIADIALRQDIDLIVSQIPEWFTAVQITRDAICEADIVDGRLARSIIFDKSRLSDTETVNIMSKIEEVEDRLDLHSIIKNHSVFDTLMYGEGCLYVIPYAKVFEDLYKYRLNSKDKNGKSTSNMFDTSSVLNGYGYGESANVEVSLYDSITNDSTSTVESTSSESGHKRASVFTEAEIIEINPSYRTKVFDESGNENKDMQDARDKQFDEAVEMIAKNIRFIESDIALPVIEESAHDLRCVYETKYRNQQEYVDEVKTFFESVMESSDIGSTDGIDNRFARIKGVYMRVLPSTKLVPIRIDRHIVGYYYISDLTRPEQSGQRKNSGLTGYTLRSPSIAQDTFSPDVMFCEKLATKIINNFNLKFMKDNTALHQQIVAILQAHKFNEAMMRFVFIPAEHVVQCTINKDGAGKGHSMLEPGLATARMYMFLKLYSLLYQINNGAIRVYNLRMSGIDKNYKEFVQETMRKFAARRITANDIFNYRSSVGKVSGGSELVMPLGAGNEPPITVETIPASDSPLNNELLESLKNEAINATPVPSAMVQGAMSELDFAKEVELANTRFNTMVNSFKIDMNRDITLLYRKILRWETDIEPTLLKDLKFAFRLATAKSLSVTAEMLGNFNAVCELAIGTFLSAEETKGGSGGEGEQSSEVVREYKKLIIAELIPQMDIERFEELADIARRKATETKLESNKSENIVDETLDNGEGLV